MMSFLANYWTTTFLLSFFFSLVGENKRIFGYFLKISQDPAFKSSLFHCFTPIFGKKNLENPLTLDSSSRLTANTIDLEFFCIAVLQIASLRSVTA